MIPPDAAFPWAVDGSSGNGRWVWIPDDDVPDQPYDDAKDHQPCDDCNPKGKGRTPGWYVPFSGPMEPCKRCEGAGWL